MVSNMTFSSRLIGWLRSGLVYLLIFLVAGFVANLWQSRNQSSGQAPAISGQALNGHWQTVDMADYQEPVLLYFFAEWCPICKLQHATIQSIDNNYPVIAIAMQSGDLENVANYVRRQDLDLFVLNDANGDMSRAFGVNGVPASFIIDAQNEIRFSTRGYASELGLLSRLWLAQME